MAHHASTPQSVLSAPSPTVVVVVAHHGATRQEHRHGISSSMKPADLRIYRLTRNVPYVRTTPRRGRKVVRGGLA
jgi:hypothetical protein